MDGVVKLKHIAGTENIADGFTKPLTKTKFEKFRMSLGVKPRTDYVELE
jgi:hypothetical protein